MYAVLYYCGSSNGTIVSGIYLTREQAISHCVKDEEDPFYSDRIQKFHFGETNFDWFDKGEIVFPDAYPEEEED